MRFLAQSVIFISALNQQKESTHHLSNPTKCFILTLKIFCKLTDSLKRPSQVGLKDPGLKVADHKEDSVADPKADSEADLRMADKEEVLEATEVQEGALEEEVGDDPTTYLPNKQPNRFVFYYLSSNNLWFSLYLS